MILLKICNKIIEYSFYAIFLLVPLAFTSATSELFEMNKMWLTWALTIIIAGAWFSKMVLQRQIIFQRTPLDIPIGLFLFSQIISTIFSLDNHVSLWGYYSRFNGGLLSMFSYIFLYYAFLSNLSNLSYLRRLLFLSLISGLIVSLWGLPSHFGYDPTCLLFRGTFDISCWTADFIPTIRIFSTLGQPDWLAAYLAILLPISIIMFIKFIKNLPLSIFYFLLSALFYIDLLYTRARSGILAVWISLAFFFAIYLWSQKRKFSTFNFQLSTIIGILLLITFIIGTPINQVRMLTLDGIKSAFQKPAAPATTETLKQAETQKEEVKIPHDPGGTESGHIRLLVWEGALNAWKSNPLFGTGVETFAFAYYKYKPANHNLTSEWNFLYNKAHNEYLNYLATTGMFGLGTYLAMIVVFLWIVLAKITNSFAKFAKQLASVREKQETESPQNNMLILALLSGYISILVTNFFGFSVVITNIYLFMIPAFVFVLGGIIPRDESRIKNHESKTSEISLYQWTFVFAIILVSLFMILTLFRFWRADISYALGYNLDRAGEYQNAYPHLHKAVQLRGDEPVFKDELSINDAIIATSIISQPDNDKLDQATQDQTAAVASTLAQEAINTSNEVVAKHPNNAVFWKTRVRLFFTLAQVDSRYFPRALDAIQKASLLAPQDANITYNLGVLYGQNNNIKKGIEALEKTIKLKPNYRDAHYALGLFYEQNNQREKAIDEMKYILEKLNPQDSGAKESIANWAK